jgi:hypothetical protein
MKLRKEVQNGRIERESCLERGKSGGSGGLGYSMSSSSHFLRIPFIRWELMLAVRAEMLPTFASML